MSASNTSVADAIKSFTAPASADTPIYRLPGDEQLSLLGMDLKRYMQEMDTIFEQFEYIGPSVTQIFNELPECPETKLFRVELQDIQISPVLKPRDPLLVQEELIDLLWRALLYYHHQCFKRSSRIFKRVKPKLPTASEGIGALVEISPKNKTEERAMVLLKILKSRPQEAISSKRAQDIIGGSEGRDVDPTVARRAMEFLGLHYAPYIIYEPFGKMHRIRTNFSQNDC